MPVQPSEVLFYLSNPNAGTGFSGAGAAGNSLGKFMSTTQVSGNMSLDNLFLDITGPENAADQVDYQCLFVMNNTASGLNMSDVYGSFPVQFWTPGGAGLALGLDPIGSVPYNSAAVQAQTILNSLSAPAGVTWNPGPHSLFSNGIAMHAIPPQYCVAVWIQRSAMDTAPITQSAQFMVTYQTLAS